MARTGGSPARADLAQLDQLQTERLDLRDDAEHCGPILEQAGEDRLPAVDVMDHRGKGRERRGAKLAIDPDAVQVRPSTHATIVRRGWVTRQHLNVVIVVRTSGLVDPP
jgi:hypothetical protein